MNRWKAILAAGLIFASGFVSGALAVRMARVRQPVLVPASAQGAAGAAANEVRNEFIGKLQAEVGLDLEQARRVDAILQEGRQRMHQIWDTCQPKVREEMKRVRGLVHAQLTEEQRSRYDDFMKRARDRRGPRGDGEGFSGKMDKDKEREKGSVSADAGRVAGERGE